MQSEVEEDVPVSEIDLSEKMIAYTSEDMSNSIKSVESNIFSKPKLEF